jgi:hypothetical protein
MPLIPPPTSDFPRLPELQPIPVIVDEVTRYMDTQFPEPDGTIAEKIRVVLVPTSAGQEDGKIFVSGKPSWNSKSNLLPLVQAAAKRQLTQDELNKLDPDAWLPGKELVVIGQYPEGSNYFKVSAYMRTAVNGAKPKAAGPVTQAAIDQGGVVVTPQRTSRQATAVGAGSASPTPVEVDVDSIPF